MIEDLQVWWEKMMWISSPEHKENVSLRLAAHRKAMETGFPSPYTHPEKYDFNWKPLPELAKR